MEQNRQVDIDEFVHDGVHYCHFLSRCPVDCSQAPHVIPSFWKHDKCGGDIYIGDDATFYCKSCGMKFHISHARFECPEHSQVEDYTISFSSKVLWHDVIGAMDGKMIYCLGIQFLTSLLKTL